MKINVIDALVVSGVKNTDPTPVYGTLIFRTRPANKPQKLVTHFFCFIVIHIQCGLLI